MPLTNAPLEKIWVDCFLKIHPRLLHLQRMVNETGWLPVQKRSAQIALDVLINIAVDNDQSQE